MVQAQLILGTDLLFRQGGFDMSAIIKSETISRRKALSLMGLAAAFGLAAAPTVLTVSDTEAQTAAAPTAGMKRRAARHERRQERRTGTAAGTSTTTGAATTTGTGTGEKK
jgi:hypothetical protein